MVRLIIRWHKGFTLVELLIALAIIGLGLAGVFGLFPLGLRSSRLAGDLTTVTLIGRETIDQITAAATTFDPADTGFVFGARDNDGAGYFDLPLEKGDVYVDPRTVNFPEQGPGPIAQRWTLVAWQPPGALEGTALPMQVIGSESGLQANLVDFSEANPFGYTSDNDEITFTVERHRALTAGETIVLEVRVVSRRPYYWTAYRSDYNPLYQQDPELAPMAETKAQCVTVVVAWGWPGEVRTKSFSTVIANQFM